MFLHMNSRYGRLFLYMLFFILLSSSTAASEGVIPESLHVESVDAESDLVTQNINFAAQVDDSGTVITIDVSELPDGISLVDASIESAWDAKLSDISDDEILIEIDGESTGEAGNEIQLDLDTSGYSAETESVYVISVEDGGEIERSFNIHGDTAQENHRQDDEDHTSHDPGAQSVVYVRVLDPGGEHLPEDEVDAWAQDGASTSGGSVQEDGTVRLSPSPGTWNLRADAEGYAPGVIEDVELTRGEREEPYEVNVQRGGLLEGKVTDTNGDPINDATIEIEDREGIRTLTHTDENGEYSITLASKSYSVRAFDESRVSEEYKVLDINSVEDVEETDFKLQAPEIVEADFTHLDGSEPDMNEIGLRTETQGGLVFIEIGPDPSDGTSIESAFSPQDLAKYGVDDSTSFEVQLEVERFNPDAVIGSGRNTEWEIERQRTEKIELNLQVSPAHLELNDEMPRKPLTPSDEEDINWPTRQDDTSDQRYEQAVQLAFIETPGLSPSERQTLRGMSATTNAQAFGFPRLEDGELSVYLGAPSERTNGEQHTGFYTVHIPEELLEDWNAEDPERDLETMWEGNEQEFTVEETENGAQIAIDRIEYSDGTMTIRSTEYQETMLDKIPGTADIKWKASQVWQELRIWIALRTPW